MANFDALTQNQMEAIYRPHTKAFDNAFEFKVFGKDDPWMYMYSDAKVTSIMQGRRAAHGQRARKNPAP